jgi:hypothetical protein
MRAACGPNVLISWSGGTSGLFCLYDAQGTLFGTLGGTDSPSYCQRFGSWKWGARIYDECLRSMGSNVCAAAQP